MQKQYQNFIGKNFYKFKFLVFLNLKVKLKQKKIF